MEILGELRKFGLEQARESSWFSGTKLYKNCNRKTSWDTVSVFGLVHFGKVNHGIGNIILITIINFFEFVFSIDVQVILLPLLSI